jgi:hypothetical protein
MELLPEAHGDRFVVPDAITLEQLEDSIKRGVCALLPYGTKYEDWYPPLVVPRSTGTGVPAPPGVFLPVT